MSVWPNAPVLQLLSEVCMRPYDTVVKHLFTTHLPYVPHVAPRDDQVTNLYTPWTTPSVTVARNSSGHVCFSLRISTVSKSEILNILKPP